jgi:hypothetical protein
MARKSEVTNLGFCPKCRRDFGTQAKATKPVLGILFCYACAKELAAAVDQMRKDFTHNMEQGISKWFANLLKTR